MIKDTKLAVLIDGDNIPSKYIKEMMEDSQVRHAHHQAHLWRLDQPTRKQMEGSASRNGHHACAAVQLHFGQECYRQRHDH